MWRSSSNLSHRYGAHPSDLPPTCVASHTSLPPHYKSHSSSPSLPPTTRSNACFGHFGASMEGTAAGKRIRLVSGGGEAELPDVKRMRDHILDVLNDDDDRESAAGPELVTVMKSLADEIDLMSAVDPEVASGSVGSLSDLGYLLGASDDELGLLPTLSDNGVGKSSKQSGGHVSGEAEAINFDDLWAFEDHGVLGGDGGDGNQPVREDAGVFDGLSEYSDGFCDPFSDFADVPWRGSEFLSAL